MSKGYVYILSNESMPGLVKIGRTSRAAEGRAQELFVTGVPTPFKVEESLLFPDAKRAESDLHKKLRKHRVYHGREFFRVSVDEAAKILWFELFITVDNLIREFLPECGLSRRNLQVSEARIYDLANHFDEPSDLIAKALSDVRPEEIRPSVDRARVEMNRLKSLHNDEGDNG